MLDIMGKLFAIEAAHRGCPLDERLVTRQAEAVPMIERLKAFLDWAHTAGSAIMPLHGAIGYMLDRWDAFVRHATDGWLEMSNNAAERAIRPTAIGGKIICSAAPTPAGSGSQRSTPSSKARK